MKNTNNEHVILSLGNWQKLKIVNLTSVGAYLGDDGNKVLLPKKQVPKEAQIGDELNVFLYRDSNDRMISTINKPLIVRDEVAVLKVKQITDIGAFLDWGLEKDLFLPFKQQTQSLEEGLYYPVALYVDRSDRLAATMWIDKYIKGADINEKRKAKSLIQLQSEAENVYVRIYRKGGYLPYNDRVDASIIEKDFGLSKNTFKRAIGLLYKARRLVINEDSIELRVS